ncbi:MAG: metallophosphoesterase family protein, partial [Chloroflexota bacterium]
MNLLLFSDLHVNHRQAEQLVARSAEVDVVVGAGDFASVRQGLASTIAILKSIEKPVVLVPGNNESLDELVDACRGWPAAHVLHGNGTEILGQQFYGIGGGIPVTPFGAWSYDFTEEQAV